MNIPIRQHIITDKIYEERTLKEENKCLRKEAGNKSHVTYEGKEDNLEKKGTRGTG